MSYAEHWAALAARIGGLQSAGSLSASFGPDDYGAGRYLREQCGLAVLSLEKFRREHEVSLPVEAKDSLDRFFNTTAAKAAKDNSTAERGAKSALVALAAVESEITFILAGRQELIRARSERAFLLLNRQLVVDVELRRKWRSAFDDAREPECERLGSVHLLSQGIYAFKINAEGARTDLIFDEPPDAMVGHAAEGLVLTEWKKASQDSWPTQYNTAQVQSDIYRQGALAGIELRDYCYLVAVSLKALPPKADNVSGNIRYRHINVVVNPDAPSAAAKKLSKKL